MEEYGFQKVLHGMEARDINIRHITTDRHVQVIKCMKGEGPNVSHQFDIWLFCKNIRKTLKPAKTKSRNRGNVERALAVNIRFAKNGQPYCFIFKTNITG